MAKGDIISRRKFFSSTSTVAASAAAIGWFPLDVKKNPPALNQCDQAVKSTIESFVQDPLVAQKTLDLSPARWIFYPAERILPNSFFHFLKQVYIKKAIASAMGWIVGDSRYVLFCNGKRIQFGPAPSDPRYTEADPVNLTQLLVKGDNAIGATVLYYGFGDGTWPAGKAGFIFKLEIVYDDGSKEMILSDTTWRVQLAKSWQAGMYKRWYLRALQESFDNRQYPYGWNESGYKPDETWRHAMVMGDDADKTALNTSITDYLYDSGSPVVSQLRKRAVPLLQELKTPVLQMVDSHWLRWNTSVSEYFDLVTKDAYEAVEGPTVKIENRDAWAVDLPGNGNGFVITFEMKEQLVGWPYFSINAPTGTTVELLVQQGHVPYHKGGPALINNNLHSWTRFICKEGLNHFMTFDYESVKWIQLHIHNSSGNIQIAKPGVLRRLYPFPATPVLSSNDPALQKLFEASFNTVLNNSHDTIVDCMGRERQQYSGDIGHVVHILHRAYNETQLPSRFINTFSQGITLDGFFMDSWPAYDRLNRYAQRQLGLSPWGPLLDHSVGFTYDVWYHYLYSGNLEDLHEVFPRLVRFYQYLRSTWPDDKLFKVEGLGVPTVWLDTDSYKRQRHKQCAFNLYIAGMLKDAFANLCKAFGRSALQQEALSMSEQIVKAVRTKFWSKSEGILVNNLPWIDEEGEVRTCERSVSHYILSGFATETEKTILVRELIELPPRFGLCYPPNAQWRYWALAATGNIQHVLNEFRTKWISLESVQLNNTLPETWNPLPDQHSQYSHASIAPIYLAYMSIAGVSILQPGGKQIKIEPQPGDLESFKIVNHTANGPINVEWAGGPGNRRLVVKVPTNTTAELWLDAREDVKLPIVKKTGGKVGYSLPSDTAWVQVLKYT